MRNRNVILVTACFLVGCGKEKAGQDPPIQLEVIAPALPKQFEGKIGESFLKIGKVKYKAYEKTYLVEVYFAHEDREERFVMSMLRSHDETDRNVLAYKGVFPLHLIGDKSPGIVVHDFKVDELMNK